MAPATGHGDGRRVTPPPVADPTPGKQAMTRDWLVNRAAADPAMAAAARRRDAVPAPPERTEQADVASVLTRAHDQVSALLQQLKAIPGAVAGGSRVEQSRRQSIIDMINVALSRHEAAEESDFWPRVRSVLAEGDALADAALEQEQHGKDLLKALVRTPPSDPDFDALAEDLETAIRRHVAFEERVLLAIAETVTPADRTLWGARLAEAQRRGPTRPHRHAPKSPGRAVRMAAAVGAAMDHLRDRLGDRPAKRRGRADPAAEMNDASGGRTVVGTVPGLRVAAPPGRSRVTAGVPGRPSPPARIAEV